MRQSLTFITQQDSRRIAPIPFVDCCRCLRRSPNKRNIACAQSAHGFVQILGTQIRKTENASRAGADDLAVVETDGTSQGNASRRAKRFTDSKNSSDVSWILQPTQNEDQFRRNTEYVIKCEVMRLDSGDESLRVLG